MKKIISLLASVAMLASVFTSVSAATLATNNPVASTVIEEIDEDTYCEFTYEDELGEGNKAYLVTVDFTGLDLSNVRGGSADAAEKKTRTGVLMSAGQYEIVWDSEDHIVGIFDEDREAADPAGVFTQSGTSLCIFNANGITDMLPKASNNNDKVVTATEIRANSFVVVTDGTPVKGTVEATLVLRQKEKSVRVGIANYDPSTIGYSVNGEDTNVVTLGEADEPIIPDEPKEMEITVDPDRFDLDVDADGVADGYAWEVFVANYDSTKTVSAKFTDAETGATRAGKEKTEITGLAPIAEATGGSVDFVALLQLSQFRNVNMEIVVE